MYLLAQRIWLYMSAIDIYPLIRYVYGPDGNGIGNELRQEMEQLWELLLYSVRKEITIFFYILNRYNQKKGVVTLYIFSAILLFYLFFIQRNDCVYITRQTMLFYN